jgi:cation diffusion facilitator family transporter
MKTSGGTRPVVAAFVVNVGIAATTFAALLLSRSPALLAPSISAVAGAAHQGLLLITERRSSPAATERHPLGHDRDRYLYAFLGAVVLFSVGSLLLLHEGWAQVREPRPAQGGPVLPLLILVAVVSKSYSLRTAIVESNRAREGRDWFRFVRTATAPELSVVLVEDSGAVLGLLLAFTGVSLTLVTGDGVFEALATSAVGVLLAAVAVVLAVQTKGLLVGESASAADTALIVLAATAVPAVTRVVHLKTLHLGPDEILVAAKIGVAPMERAAGVASTIDAAEAMIRSAVPAARVIYLEPDLDRTDPIRGG